MKDGIQTRSKTRNGQIKSQAEAPVQAVVTDCAPLFAPIESISSDMSSLQGSPYHSDASSPLGVDPALDDISPFSLAFAFEDSGLDLGSPFELPPLASTPLPPEDQYGSFIKDETKKPASSTLPVEDDFDSFLKDAWRMPAIDHSVWGYNGDISAVDILASCSGLYVPSYRVSADKKTTEEPLDLDWLFADNEPCVQSAPLVVCANNGTKKNEDETQGSEKKEQPQPPETSKPITPALEATKRRAPVPVLPERKSKLKAIEKMYNARCKF